MTIKIGAYLNRHIEIGASHELSPDSLLILPAGTVELFGMDDVVMDEAAAQAVLATFNERGVEVPVDYEHSTKIKAGSGEESPAAGWITALRWEPGRGLIGSVRWSPKARQQIKNKEYKYISPHFDVDAETRRVEFVLAVALTNTPRINNMEQLIAASWAVASNTDSNTGATEMKKETRTKLCSALGLEDGAKDEEILAQVEEAVEAPAEAPTEVSPEDQAVIALKGLLLEIQRTLMEANVIGADSSLADAMQAALDLIGTSSEETAEAAASIASALGMAKDKKHTTKEIVATINDQAVKSVPATEFKKLQEEVASMKSVEKDKVVVGLVGSLVEAGQINPNNEKHMTWARNLARTQTEQFASLTEDMPCLYNSGQQTPNEATPSKRKTVIASALEDFKTDACGASKLFYVNEVMDEQDMGHLNDEEKKTHAIK